MRVCRRRRCGMCTACCGTSWPTPNGRSWCRATSQIWSDHLHCIGHERRGLSISEARRSIEVVRGDRLEALWVCALSLGLRRGELLGLRWVDVDFEAETDAVRQALLRVNARLAFTKPKTERSARVIPAPPVLLDRLRAHRAAQAAERLGAGARWKDSGLAFTSQIGTAAEPRNIDRALARRAPPCRLGLAAASRPPPYLRNLLVGEWRIAPNGGENPWSQPDRADDEYLRSRAP